MKPFITARAGTIVNAASVSQRSTALAIAKTRGTRLDSDSARLSVLSYNLLAPLYVRPIDQRTGAVQEFAAFRWAADEDLDWDKRQERLRWELENAAADVICLQEVQFEWRASPKAESCVDGEVGMFQLPGWLQLPGYRVRIPGQRELQQIASRNARVLCSETAIGNALLWRSDRLELAKDVEEMAPKKARGQETTRVGACLRGLSGSPLTHLGPTAIFSVHLDATSEAQRVGSLHRCFEITRALRTREVLIAGDMNSELLPGSCVAACLHNAKQPSEDELIHECANAHRLISSSTESRDSDACSSDLVSVDLLEEWYSLWNAARAVPEELRVDICRAPTGPTRAAYAHGAQKGPCVSWRLDHILFSPRSLMLASYWGTLEDDPDSAASGIPNSSCPSDHLPVAATFDVNPVPVLPEESIADLVAQISEVGMRQKSDLEHLSELFQQEIKILEAEEAKVAGHAVASGSDSEGDSCLEGKKKTRKGKKGRGKKYSASDAMVQLKRSQRSRSKDIKIVQRQERDALIESLGELELDALEISIDIVAWRDGGGPVVLR